MRRLLFNILVLFPSSSYASLQDVCDSISALVPSIQDEQLNQVATSTYKLSQVYGIEWKIPLAIFKQESNFNYKAINYKSRDFGIGQLHYTTLITRKVDLGTLLTDSHYAIQQTLLILSELHEKYAKIDSKAGWLWYTRYHSFTPSYRAIYTELLKKHLKVIEDIIRESKKKEERVKAKNSAGNTKPSSGERTQTEDQRTVCNPR